MQPGRVPEWNLVADLDPTAWLEAVELATDGRISLPAPLRQRVDWCAQKKGAHLLASIGNDGGVTVEPMAGWDAVRTRIAAMLEKSPVEERQGLVLGAMASHFRISYQPDGRLRLPPPLTHHLQRDGDAKVWVASCTQRITLWRDADWRAYSGAAAAYYRKAVNTAI